MVSVASVQPLHERTGRTVPCIKRNLFENSYYTFKRARRKGNKLVKHLPTGSWNLEYRVYSLMPYELAESGSCQNRQHFRFAYSFSLFLRLLGYFQFLWRCTCHIFILVMYSSEGRYAKVRFKSHWIEMLSGDGTRYFVLRYRKAQFP